jgi:hypothetical protein
MKLALGGLSVLLIVVIAVSYYMNNEGFYVSSLADAESALNAAAAVLMSATTAENAAKTVLADAKAAADAAPTDTTKATTVINASNSLIAATNAKDLANAKAIIAEKARNAAKRASRNVPRKMPGNRSTTYTPIIGGTGGENASRPVSQPISGSSNLPQEKHKDKKPWARGYPVSNDNSLLREYKNSLQPKQPEVSISETAYDAMKLNQESNLLKNIQKIIKNELTANRQTEMVRSNNNISKSNANEQGNEYKSAQRKKWNGISGREDPSNCAPYKSNSSQKMYTYEDEEDACSANSYIKKDEIPCWGCNLDY